MSRTPIADYALISDCHSAALVSKAGSIDWLCVPRFDSPSVFGRILGDAAGHWSIRPATDASVNRKYLGRSMVLETTFRTEAGAVTLTDAMALDSNQEGHDLGARAPRVIVRRVECLEGEVELEMEFSPRPEYGLISPVLAEIDGGLTVRGGADMMVLSTPEQIEIERSTARMRLTVRTGDAVGFALNHRPSWEEPPRIWTQEAIASAIDDTARAWTKWSSLHQVYEGPWEDLVYDSGRVLQALTYQPTGAIVAAPTTSLPEIIGGERNWDYRYAWVRDASFTLDALWVAACPDEAQQFFSWMAGTVTSQILDGSDLQIMFGVEGDHDLSERELPHLPGWRNSRPVRVGNGAWNQRQLDVYGELLDAAYRLRDQLGSMDDATKTFLVHVAEAAANRWQETDHGIWEFRGVARHFVYSKVMCWLALARAVEMADLLGAGSRVEKWKVVRDQIRQAILQDGWSDAAGAFTQSFGSDELDASNLMMPIVGFLPADDPRVLATIDATAERLTDERGLVYRYRTEDGLKGDEGTFLLCTFWLAQALAMAGQTGKARDTFETAIAFANDLGLLSEEVDEESGELLGNFPQAFSHIGLINAAWAISEAERAAARHS